MTDDIGGTFTTELAALAVGEAPSGYRLPGEMRLGDPS